MKFSLVVIASAVAAALGAPAAVAQTSPSNDPARAQERSPTDGRSGGAGVPSSTSGAVPSTEPRQGQAAPSTSPGVSDRRPDTASPAARGGPTGPTGARPGEQSTTDGRSGGTGPASATSGAVPATDGGTAAAGDRRMSSSKRDGSMMQSAADVRAAQQALQDKGYDAGPIDGLMGPKTQAAIREFQQKEGIQASGQLDARTRSALN
jgi:hypothetical protein